MNRLYLFCLLILSGISTQAQQPAKTFYFMDNAPIRLGLNPALQPQKGFFSFPLLGSIGASVITNGLSVQDFMDMLDDDGGYLQNDRLINKLKTNNFMNADLALDLISFGFYAGKGFWSVDIGAKVAVNSSVPKSMFEFVRNIDNLEEDIMGGDGDYEIRDLQFHINAFGQVGVGYSRPIFDWLTVGGKVKFLVGLANLDMEVNEMRVQGHNDRWQVTTRARLDASVQGLKLTESQDGYIEDFDFDKPGIGGYGVGFDLGASATFLEHLNVSAAITDLGFIKWNKSATTTARTDESYSYTPGENVNIFDEELFQLKTTENADSRKTALYSTLNLGAEYSFWRNRVGVGLLSSTTFYKPKSYSELTASVNFRPGSWFGASLSYSFLHSETKTFGFGLRFGPLFLATDYMILGNFEDISCANAYVGINFPIGKKNARYKNNKKQDTIN